MIIKCKNCQKEFYKKPYYIKHNKNICCSIECKNEYANRKIKCNCATCGKEVYRIQSQINKSKTGNVFCDHSCSAKFSNKSRSGFGVSTYRKKAFDSLPNKCDMCGYDKITDVLVVHHIDRDRNNSDISNLQILCPTCHIEEHYHNKDGIFSNLKNNTE